MLQSFCYGSKQDVSFHAYQGERAQPTRWKWPRVGIADLKFGISWLNISLRMTLYDFVPFRAFFPFFSKSQKLSSVKTGAKRVPDKLSGACRPEISVLMPTEFWNPTPPSFALFAQINQNCSCSLHGKSITKPWALGAQSYTRYDPVDLCRTWIMKEIHCRTGKKSEGSSIYIYYISMAFVWVKVHNESICRRVPP